MVSFWPVAPVINQVDHALYQSVTKVIISAQWRYRSFAWHLRAEIQPYNSKHVSGIFYGFWRWSAVLIFWLNCLWTFTYPHVKILLAFTSKTNYCLRYCMCSFHEIFCSLKILPYFNSANLPHIPDFLQPVSFCAPICKNCYCIQSMWFCYLLYVYSGGK